MSEKIEFNLLKTIQRVDALEAYFQAEVLAGSRFICPNYKQCRDSHPGTFYPGQLHHIGNHYDASILGKPYRIMIVGQEYGHKPALVSMDQRRKMVLETTGLQKNFSQRNPHMRGVTSALRLLFGLPTGNDYPSEFLCSGTERFHIFDAFALVNFLLCSAVDESEGRRGKATKTMLRNCQNHFRKAVEILDPTVMIVQSKGFWENIIKIFDEVQILTNELYKVRLGDTHILTVVFTHPSTPDNRGNWGRSANTPYLQSTVEPAIEQVRNIVFGFEAMQVTPQNPPILAVTLTKQNIFEERKMETSTLTYDVFYSEMQARLRLSLPQAVLARKPKFHVKSNRMHITLSDITGSHYEICLRQNYHEIALHFQSTPERSLERRQVFDPKLNDFSKILGRPVQSGNLENRGWMRVWIECPLAPITEELLVEYSDLFSRFIAATFPDLERTYENQN